MSCDKKIQKAVSKFFFTKLIFLFESKREILNPRKKVTFIVMKEKGEFFS